MKYIEIIKNSDNTPEISLFSILSGIKSFTENIDWFIQHIEATGNVRNIVGMNMLEFEKRCKESLNGISINYDKLIEIAVTCDDIIDILLTGYSKGQEATKAYKDDEWESKCEIIVSREDSTLWRLFSKNDDIMKCFTEVSK